MEGAEEEFFSLLHFPTLSRRAPPFNSAILCLQSAALPLTVYGATEVGPPIACRHPDAAIDASASIACCSPRAGVSICPCWKPFPSTATDHHNARPCPFAPSTELARPPAALSNPFHAVAVFHSAFVRCFAQRQGRRMKMRCRRAVHCLSSSLSSPFAADSNSRRYPLETVANHTIEAHRYHINCPVFHFCQRPPYSAVPFHFPPLGPSPESARATIRSLPILGAIVEIMEVEG